MPKQKRKIWDHILRFLTSATCSHLFKANEMQPRDSEGNVKWECCKCKKLFVASFGLKILENGRCDGRWDLPNKYFNIS